MNDARSSSLGRRLHGPVLAMALLQFFLAGGIWALDGSAPSDPVFAHPLDQDSSAAFGASFGALGQNPVLGGNFVQAKEIRRIGRTLTSKGTFLFAAQYGIYWQISSPYPSTLLVTADRIVQKSSDGSVSEISAKDNEVFRRIAGTMQAVFSGDEKALEGEFTVYFQKTDRGWKLGLIPREKMVLAVISAIVVEGDDTIASLRLYEAQGDSVTYSFSAVRKASSLTEKEHGFFVF